MASLHYAYSIEIDDTVDAEQAYELFWSGIIKNASAFTCPEEGCEGNVTCINIDKAENDMLQHPHFRGYNHSPKCELAYPKSSNSGKRTNSNGTGNKSELDEFFLTRPEAPKSTSSNNLVQGVSITSRTSASKSDKVYRSKYFSIRSLVSKFVTYRKQQKEGLRYVQIGNQKITYKNLFNGVYNQNFDNLFSNRVYWGVAYLNRKPNTDYYHIRFEEAFEYEGSKIKPSFFLSDKLIQNYHSRLIEKRIELYSKQQPPRAIVFLFGTLEAVEKDDKIYINFKVDNLDMLDIRGLDFFEKLRKE